MIKCNELANPSSCLNKAESNEPLFVLRAKDPLAPQTIRHWATMSMGVQPTEKVTEAFRAAEAMEQWRAQAYPAAAELKA